MTFLNAAILIGLVGAALPVIIHLLNRRRARVIDWGAMRFLEMSLASRGRRVMLEEILLLAARTLLVALLVLAMARPLLVNRHFAPAGAAGQDVVIILDGSLSMTVTPPTDAEGERVVAADGADYFEQARRTALQAVDRLAPGDAVAVVLAGPTPRRLTETLTVDRDAARAAIQDARATQAAANVPDAIAQAGLLLDAGQNAHKQVLVITDGRMHGWRAGSTRQWQALAGQLAASKRAPSVQVLELARGREQPSQQGQERKNLLTNLAIERVRVSRPVVGADLPVVLTVTVRNTGSTPAPAGVRLTLRPAPDATPIASQTVADLARNAQADVQLRAHFTRPGPYRLVFELDFPDALAGDNRLVFAMEVLKTLPVLLVNGAPSPTPDRDECFWLRAAFQPARQSRHDVGGDSRLEFLVAPTIIEPALLDHENLDSYGAVILANVAELPQAAVDRLKSYVTHGGGLIIAPGDAAKPAFYNDNLGPAGAGLLPATLGEPVELKPEPIVATQLVGQEDEAPGKPLKRFATACPSMQGHPALIGSADPALWEFMRVFRHYPLTATPDSDASTVLRLIGLPGGGEQPFALDKPVGRGHVVLLGGPLDSDWSSCPLHDAYVVLVNELVYYLSATQRMPLNLAGGEMLAIPAPSDAVGAAAEVRTPDERAVPLTRVFEDGRWVFLFGQTAQPGVYELRRSGGRDEGAADEETNATETAAAPGVVYFTVQRDAGESRLDLLDQTARDTVGQSLAGVSWHSDAAALLDSLRVRDPGWEIWKYLALAVLALLLLEIWLSGRITRGRHGSFSGGVRFGH